MRALLILGGLSICVLLVTSDRTKDEESKLKTKDSESLTGGLTNQGDSKCPHRGKKQKDCRVRHPPRTPLGRAWVETNTDEEMKMDSEAPDRTIRRHVKRDDPPKKHCSRRGKNKDDCKVRHPPRTPVGRTFDSLKTNTDEEVKTDSKAPDRTIRRHVKRDDTNKKCCPCRGKKPKNCKVCQSSCTPLGTPLHRRKSITNEEMKTDSEAPDRTIRRHVKRDETPKKHCSRRGKKKDDCKVKYSSRTPLGRAWVGLETKTDEEMKTDSEAPDRTSRRHVKRDDSKKKCCPCRGKKPVDCKVCHAACTPLGRSFVDRKNITDEEREIYDLTEFLDQNEDGSINGMMSDSPSATDQQAQPPASMMLATSTPQKRKKCIGCYTSLVTGGERIKFRQSRGVILEDTEQPTRRLRGEGGRRRKKNGGRHRHEERGEGKRRSHHHSESEMEEKINPGRNGHLDERMEKEEFRRGRPHHRHHHHHHPKSKENKRRHSGSWSRINSSHDGGTRENPGDGMEAAQEIRRQSNNPAHLKEGPKGKLIGSRSLIASARLMTDI